MHNSFQTQKCIDLLDCILESIVSLDFIPLGGNKNKISGPPKTWIPWKMVVKNGDASHGIRIRNKNHQLNKQKKRKKVLGWLVGGFSPTHLQNYARSQIGSFP